MTGQAAPLEGAAPAPRRARPGRARRGLQWLLRMALALMLAAGLGVGVLAWRLAQGPVDVTWFDDHLSRGVELGGGLVRARGVSLAWDGWRHGGAALPAIRLTEVSFTADGASASAEAVLVHLSLAALLRGELAPTLLELHTPRLILSGVGDGVGDDDPPDAESMRPWLAAPDESRRHLALRGLRVHDGSVELAAVPSRPAISLEGVSLTALRGGEGLSADGRGVVHLGGSEIPITIEGAGGRESSRLRGRVRGIRPALLAGVVPALLPLAALDTEVEIEVTLTLDGALAPRSAGLALAAGPGRYAWGEVLLPFRGLELQADLHTEGGEVPSATLTLDTGERLQGNGRAYRRSGEWQAEANLSLPALDLAALPHLWPENLAPAARAEALRMVRAGRLHDASGQVVLRATEAGTRLVSLGARLPAQALRLGPGQGVVVSEALLRAGGDGVAWRLEELTLRLPSPRPGATPSTITASGSAQRQDGWQAGIDLTLDQVAFADLPSLWPPEVAPAPRSWLTENITAGIIRQGAWRFDLTLPEGGAPQLRGLSGRARAVDATVQWLAPIPPVIGVSGDAVFTADSVTLTTEGGRQARADGTPTGIELGAGTMRFTELGGAVEKAELNFQLGGSLPDLLAVLRHPRMHLFDRRPLDLVLLDGRHTSQVTIGFPLLNDIPNDAIRVRAEGRLSNLRVARALLGRDLENGVAELVVDQDRLRLQGTASMLGAPLRLLTEMDFRQGPATGIIARESVQGTVTAAQLQQVGFDLGDVLGGSVAIDGRTERRRNGQATVQLRADLAPATLDIPAARWGKRVGSPGRAEALLRLQGDNLVAVENGRVDVLDLSLRGRAIVTRGRIERYELAESLFGASRFQGDVRPPAQPGAPWLANLRGPLLDLRPLFAERRADEAPTTGNSPPMVVEARFDRVTMGERRELFGVQGRAVVDERSVMRQGSLRGRTAQAGGVFELAVAPRGPGRSLRITAEDGGAVLRALDNITTIEGGRLTLNGGWADNEPTAALTGTAELEAFAVRGAPAIGKLLQAMTLYGMVDALQGGQGLSFARAEVPFTLTSEALTLNDARAFSASLGLTGRGRILREADILDLEGTIVPAYLFNSLLGNLPVLGRLFSPEPGGGVFATTYRVQGPAADPQVQVNPLSTLTPGFLRGLFGLGQTPASTQSPPAPAARPAAPRR